MRTRKDSLCPGSPGNTKEVVPSRSLQSPFRRLIDRRDVAHERGAVLIEAAMVTTFLMMLLVGTVTAAVAYSQKTSLQTAAREASRFAATLPVNGDMTGFLTRVADVAKGAANGDLGDSVAGQSICVAYVYPKGTTADDRNARIVQKGGVTGAPTHGPTSKCFDDGRPDDERRVQVTVGRKATLQAVVFSTQVELTSRSTARFERTN